MLRIWASPSHAVEMEHHDPGDWAVIIGAGPIGILAAQTLVAWGINTIITDLSDARLEFAERHSGRDSHQRQAPRSCRHRGVLCQEQGRRL